MCQGLNLVFRRVPSQARPSHSPARPSPAQVGRIHGKGILKRHIARKAAVARTATKVSSPPDSGHRESGHRPREKAEHIPAVPYVSPAFFLAEPNST